MKNLINKSVKLIKGKYMGEEILQRKGDYHLTVGVLEDGTKGYKLWNHVYKVVEVETKILPQAYKYLEDLSAGLDAARDISNDDKEEYENEA